MNSFFFKNNDSKNDSSNLVIYKEKKFITITELSNEKTNFKVIPKKVEYNNNSILLFIFVSLTFVVVIIKSSYLKFINYLIDSFSNYKISKRFFNEKNISYNRIALTFDIIYFINFSLYIYLIYNFLTNTKNFDIYQFFIIFLFVLGYTLIKNLLQKLIAFIFDSQKVVSEYIFQKSVLNKWLGLVLLPTLFLMSFTYNYLFNCLLYITILIIIVFFLIKLIRNIRLINDYNIRFYHALIFYLIFEIIPLVILCKIFINFAENFNLKVLL